MKKQVFMLLFSSAVCLTSPGFAMNSQQDNKKNLRSLPTPPKKDQEKPKPVNKVQLPQKTANLTSQNHGRPLPTPPAVQLSILASLPNDLFDRLVAELYFQDINKLARTSKTLNAKLGDAPQFKALLFGWENAPVEGKQGETARDKFRYLYDHNPEFRVHFVDLYSNCFPLGHINSSFPLKYYWNNLVYKDREELENMYQSYLAATFFNKDARWKKKISIRVDLLYPETVYGMTEKILNEFRSELPEDEGKILLRQAYGEFKNKMTNSEHGATAKILMSNMSINDPFSKAKARAALAEQMEDHKTNRQETYSYEEKRQSWEDVLADRYTLPHLKARALARLAGLAKFAGDSDTAYAYCKLILTSYKKQAYPRDVADAQFAIATQDFIDKKYDEAREGFTALLGYYAHNNSAEYYLGQIRHYTGEQQ